MSRTEGTDGPDDLDSRFGEIIASLRAEGVGTSGETEKVEPARDTGEPSEPAPRIEQPGTEWRAGGASWDETMLSDDPVPDADDEHYVPPEPPPLPTPGPGGLLMMLLFGLGLLLLIAPGFIGIGQLVGTPLGLLCLASALGVLVLRSRENPPPGSDPENGSQV